MEHLPGRNVPFVAVPSTSKIASKPLPPFAVRSQQKAIKSATLPIGKVSSSSRPMQIRSAYIKPYQPLRASRLSVDTRECMARFANANNHSTVVIGQQYHSNVLQVGQNQVPQFVPVTSANGDFVIERSKPKLPQKRDLPEPDVSIIKIPTTAVQVVNNNVMSYQQQTINGPSTIVKPNLIPALPIANTTVVMPTGSSGTISDLKLIAATTPTSALKMYRPIAPKTTTAVMMMTNTNSTAASPTATTVSSILLSPTVSFSATTTTVPMVPVGVPLTTTVSNGVPTMVIPAVVKSNLIPANQEQQPPQPALYAGGSKLMLPLGTTIKVTQHGATFAQQPLPVQPSTVMPVSTAVSNPQLLHTLVQTPTSVLPSLSTISRAKPAQSQQPAKVLLNARIPITTTSASTFGSSSSGTAASIIPTNIPPLFVPPNKATIGTTTVTKPVTMQMATVSAAVTKLSDVESQRIMITGSPTVSSSNSIIINNNNNLDQRRMSMGIVKATAAATIEQQELRKPIKAFPIPVLSSFTASQYPIHPPQHQHPQQPPQQSDQISNSILNKDRSVLLSTNSRALVEECGKKENVNVSLQLENEATTVVLTEDDESSNDGSMLVMDLEENITPETTTNHGEKHILSSQGMERVSLIAQANGEALVQVDNEQAQLDDESNCSESAVHSRQQAKETFAFQLEMPKTPERSGSLKRTSCGEGDGGSGSSSTNASPRLQKRSSSEHLQSMQRGAQTHAVASTAPKVNSLRRRFSEIAAVKTASTGVTIPFTDENYFIPLPSHARKIEARAVDDRDSKASTSLAQPAKVAAPLPPSNLSLLCNEKIDLPKQLEEVLKKRPFSKTTQVKASNNKKLSLIDPENEQIPELVPFEEVRRKKQRLAKENSVDRSTNSRSTSMSSDSNVLPAGKQARPNASTEPSAKKTAAGSSGSRAKKSSTAGTQVITPSESSTSLQDDGSTVSDTSTVADHLRWYDGIGYLSESTMHFEFNKFGIVQPLADEAYDLHRNTDVYHDLQLPLKTRPLQKRASLYETHDMYKCEVCLERGRAVDFVTPDFCSISCVRESSKTALRDYILNSTHALQCNALLRESKVQPKEEQKDHDGEEAKLNDKQQPSRSKRKQSVKKNVKKTPPSSNTTISSTSDDDSVSSLSLNSSAFLKRQALRDLLPPSLDDGSPTPLARPTALQPIDGSEETEFNWQQYLKKINAEPAPTYLFGPKPYPLAGANGAVENLFRVGMKLEAIDPENSSLFCVCTVVEVRGYRLKLHFDGYSTEYDFWVNANSCDIFPPGFCRSTNRTLQPPASFIGQAFSWANYLHETNGIMPAKELFAHLNQKSDRNKFEIGMAIEADDLKKSGKVCVATVADKMGDRILIHFDGWDNRYDFWVSIYSNYIHPVNWHKENNDKITAPPDWNKPFDWDKYIRYKSRTNLGSTSKAEKSLFKTRPPVPFKLGQRLEVVDRKQKKLIRPAKVVAIDGYEVNLCFEGWPREYAFWIEDDNTDLHPVNWCARTKHPLEPPPNFLLASCTYDGTCDLKFCMSRGNSKCPQKKFHDRPAECPYKRANWMSEDRKPLRISHDQVQKHNYEETTQPRQQDTKSGSRKTVASSAINVTKVEEVNGRTSDASNSPSPLIPAKRIKQETEDLLIAATSTATTPTPPPSRDPSKERIVRTKEVEPTAANSNSNSNSSTNFAPRAAETSIRLARPVIEEYGPRLMHSYEVWQRHSRYLDECTEQTGALRKNPLHWTTDEMARYIEQLPGCAEYASKIRHEEITGRSFLSFTQSDLIDYLGVKMGPAIKLYNRIIRLRQLVTTKFIQL
ncbi:uncharacterized protein LOC126561076 [Anopheles maculipalpis]|uniref:uncharacterized protein LOC126561076 n=1 Tax=Anopheles maculipalpis TaxID=1496333 RepID=UPI0021595D5A|nr:uncharacterized protein LOC126561076 [Anopheles maculipalpis]